jgi:hypothetical protein
MRRKHARKRWEWGFTDSVVFYGESDDLKETYRAAELSYDSNPGRTPYVFDRYPSTDETFIWEFDGERWHKHLRDDVYEWVPIDRVQFGYKRKGG